MSNVTASTRGRDLALTVEGIDEPFIIRPIPGNAGHQITDTFLRTNVGEASPEDMSVALAIAVDGAVPGDDGKWEPVPESDRKTWARIGDELSIAEGENVAMCAFFWQTVLNGTGVDVYLTAGGGVAGLAKATWALVYRMGLTTPGAHPSTPMEALAELMAATTGTKER